MLNKLSKKSKEYQFVYSKTADKNKANDDDAEKVVLTSKKQESKKGFISGLVKSASVANELSASVGKLKTELQSSLHEKIDGKLLDVKSKIEDLRKDENQSNVEVFILYCSFSP